MRSVEGQAGSSVEHLDAGGLISDPRAEEAAKLLSASEDGKRRVEETCRGLAEVRELLGPPGAVERAADAIAAHLQAGESNAN